MTDISDVMGIMGCSGCATTAGRRACPYHGDQAIRQEPAGVGTVIAVQGAADGMQLCALGHHAWVPWLQIPSGSWVTWCVRCRHHEQYDF